MKGNGCWRLLGRALALLLLLQIVASDDQSRPALEILPDGEVQTKAVGSSALLTCKPRVADPKLISDIQWLDPQNRVIESRKLVVLPLDSEIPNSYSKPAMYTELFSTGNSLGLFFTSLKEEHAGNYICRAQYANTQLLTKKVTMDIIVAITWDDAPENQNPILGEDFAVKCQVRAKPSPMVDWLYNGEVIRTNDHYIIDTHALKIKNVQESDDGVYTCRASVPQTGQLEERVIRVEVHTRPSIKELENPVVEIIEGEEASIRCDGDGKPRPKFSWVKMKTKENLAAADHFAVDEDNGLLRINGVRREDSGKYQCMATNAAGTATMTIQVNVIVRPKIIEFLNETVAQDQRTRLVCKAFGRPAPIVTFRKHTSEKPYSIGNQPEDDRITVTNSPDEQKGETTGELVIDRTLRSEDGMYECIASNKGGIAYQNGHLQVQFPPSFAAMDNRTIYTWEQRPVNFSCVAESIPNATIRWTYYGEQKVENDPLIQVHGNGPISWLYVTPRDPRYYTQYKCIARNQLGEAYNLVELREAPKPAEILQVTMIETTATSITFDIVPPIGAPDLPIRTISVEYKEQDTSWSVARNRTWTAGSSSGYVVENLKPQTTYEFRFAASNMAGRGNWGLHKIFSTTSRNVPGVARFLAKMDKSYVLSHHHDRYNLKWSAAPDNGERIDYYEVKWCEAKRYSGDNWVTVDSNCHSKQETRQETTITELQPDTFYTVELRAHNFLGYGAPANITIKTTRESAVSENKSFTSGVSSLPTVNFVAATLVVLYSFV
ncbi:fasciclin-2 isoform X2 [Copidosoma floridanum]|uniref:fasciclin-2 isoform X2 n=1 Tax=Copidosoma floridanum TaxID=29053 RepID=UPI0006C9BAFC|nr:fasciclin-2 isoform X2 [Copidosoma floridanum]